MSTSIVPKENRFGHYVVTTSGTYYKLGEKLVRQMEVKKPRRGIRDRVVEEAKLEGAEELWCGARFGKERGAAVLARQRMSGEGLPEAGPASKDPAAAKQADRLSASGSGSINQLDERSSPRDRKRPAAQPTPAEEAPKKKQPVRLPLEPATTTALAWLASTASPLLSSMAEPVHEALAARQRVAAIAEVAGRRIRLGAGCSGGACWRFGGAVAAGGEAAPPQPVHVP